VGLGATGLACWIGSANRGKIQCEVMALRWPASLTKVLSTTASVAAGGFVAAHTASPFAGKIAEAATKTTIEELLRQYLPAQRDALQELTEITRDVRELIAGTRAEVGVLLDTPWQTALLHMEYASQHPEQATDELEITRRKLFEAFAGAKAHAKRALIAQQLSAVYALIGQYKDSQSWL